MQEDSVKRSWPKAIGIAAIAGAVALGAIGNSDSRPIVRPKLLPGIPARDYKLVEPSAVPEPAAVSASSTRGADLDDPVTKKKLRSFTMDQPLLKSLHCSIAQAVFTIREDGTWTLSCRADQNPWFTREASALPARLADRLNFETNHVLRNAFAIRIRCYGSAAQKDAIKAIGRPVLAEIAVPSFWVQRGVPLAVKKDSEQPRADLKDNFALIDRVEFELGFAK
jgi:hypothetical protein